MNEYLYEITMDVEMTDEEMMYVNAHNSWRKNFTKHQKDAMIENTENTVN
jgi:hypothetical protein